MLPPHPAYADGILTNADIDEFIRLVKEHCGVELGFLEAQDLAKRLLQVLHTVREVASKNPPQPEEFGFHTPGSSPIES